MAIYSISFETKNRKCFSYVTVDKKENPHKLLTYKGLTLLFRTQTRGRTGMDVTPLVFETSASTDSAIWAYFYFALQR